MKLTDHFKLEEFLVTQKGIPLAADEKIVKNIQALCTNILEPIRAIAKKPIVITSGYRNKELNKKVGGKKTSFHLSGRAADFVIKKGEGIALLYPIFEAVEFGKLIYYPEENRFHVQVGKTNRVFIKAKEKKYYEISSTLLKAKLTALKFKPTPSMS